MQTELKTLQRKLGITFLFITHDQHEALSMSDRIGVFNEGRLEQVGTPHEVYNAPATRFVAMFVGAANVLDGKAALALAGAPSAMLRPERIGLGDERGARASGVVTEVQYFGAFTRVRVECLGNVPIQVDLPAHGDARAPEPGRRVNLHWDDSAVHVLLPLPRDPLPEGEGGEGAAAADRQHPLTPALSPVPGGEGVRPAR